MSDWQPIMTPTRYRMVMANVRRLSPRKFNKTPNWVLAMELFANGSTYSWQTCRYAEIDPDGFSIGPIWREAQA